MKNIKQFSKFEKSSENSENQKIRSRKQKRKKLENKTGKQKIRPYRKETGRSLMGCGPYHSARGRSEQRRTRGRRSIEIFK
jgi:hypothetical protein